MTNGAGTDWNAIWRKDKFAVSSILSDVRALDGQNGQIAACEEIASHKTSEVYDVLLTALGKRRNPLLLAISTATGNNAGIGRQLSDHAVRVPRGAQADDRFCQESRQSGTTGQGLLTYALVQDGLQKGLASPDGSGTITLSDWLHYGEKPVPSLYEEIRTGKLRLIAAQPRPWKTRVAERRTNGILRWHGDHDARRAVYNNRARLLSEVARQAFRLRAELVERSFALILDRGGMRRAWLRGRDNLHKRYLVHVAGYNLGLIMRLLIGAGTPRGMTLAVADPKCATRVQRVFQQRRVPPISVARRLISPRR